MDKFIEKRLKKKSVILDAMRRLISEGKASACSMEEIAKAAGIGKGSVYYYYSSKREIEIDLFHGIRKNFVESCQHILDSQASALEKMKNVFAAYFSQPVDFTMDEYLHLPQNADVHQSLLAVIVESTSSVIAKIVKQGVDEGIFHCSDPEEYAYFFVGAFTFLFDAGIFKLTKEQALRKLTYFAEMADKTLGVEPGTHSLIFALPDS